MNLGPRKTNQGRCSPLAGLAHGLWAGPGHGIRAMGDGIRAAPATSRLRRQKHKCAETTFGVLFTPGVL